METQKQEIKQTIQTYVDGYLNAKKELVSKAFYHETRLYSLGEGEIDKTEMIDWLKNLDERVLVVILEMQNLKLGLLT